MTTQPYYSIGSKLEGLLAVSQFSKPNDIVLLPQNDNNLWNIPNANQLEQKDWHVSNDHLNDEVRLQMRKVAFICNHNNLISLIQGNVKSRNVFVFLKNEDMDPSPDTNKHFYQTAIALRKFLIKQKAIDLGKTVKTPTLNDLQSR